MPVTVTGKIESFKSIVNKSAVGKVLHPDRQNIYRTTAIKFSEKYDRKNAI